MAHQREVFQNEWVGFSCPHCHSLFRVRAEIRGRRVECPGCGEVLGIPLSGAVLAPAGASVSGGSDAQVPKAPPEGGVSRRDESLVRTRETASRPEFPEPVQEGQRRVRRKVIKAVEEEEEFDWEAEENSERPVQKQSTDSLVPLLVGGVAVLILFAGVMAFMVLKQDRVERERIGQEYGKVIKNPVGEESSGPNVEEPEEDMRVELPLIEKRVREFLGAETIEEVLALTRGGLELEGMIRNYHSRHPLEPVNPREIAPSGNVMTSEGLWAVNVRLSDFSLKPMALERVQDHYLVDWASWVGYSEIPWEEVRETRPTEPVLFRVICSPVQYYNFGFSDDRKWRSYRLQSPDRMHTLYGYVERNSIEEGRLPKGGGPKDGDAFLLRLRFMKHSGPDQVLIDQVVSPGWVLRELDKPDPKER